jgi:integrase
MRITGKAIDRGDFRLPAHKKDALFFDEDIAGFGLRVRAGGSRKWIFQYEIGGRTRRVTFGTYPALAVEKARTTASQLHAKVKLGRDPSIEKQDSKARAAETFKASVNAYLSHQKSKLRPRSYKEVERHLLAHARPLHFLPLANIELRRLATLLSDIAAARGPVAANRVRSSLSAFFAWCVREGLLANNPAANTNKRGEESRSRVLSTPELREIWNALSDDAYSDIVRLLLLTAQRRTEIGGLLDSEIDVTQSEIQFGAERMKNGQPHILPLPKGAQPIIKKRLGYLPCKPMESAYPRPLFGGGCGFTNWSKSKRELDERILKARHRSAKGTGERFDEKGMEGWTLHDLRRTASTVMADRLKIQPHVIEAVLAHTGHKTGIHGVYNKALYLAEKAEALARWSDYLVGAVGNNPHS